MQEKSPMLRLWELGEQYHGGLIHAVFSASVGVLCGILPYFAAAQIIIGLIHSKQDTSFYLFWCCLALSVNTAFLAPDIQGRGSPSGFFCWLIRGLL